MFVLGLAIGAFGCVMTIKANLGVSPWDTFHIGLQRTFGLTIGIWSVIVGAIVIILSYLLAGMKPGVPTLLNMGCFGLFLDVFLWLDFIPEVHLFWQRMFLFLVGLFIMCVGIGLYLSPRLGAGPRDSFMLALNERMGWSIQKVRMMIEITVLVLGFFFGGPVSIGTVLIALLTGPLIQRTIPFWEKRMQKPYGMIPKEQLHA
ncbi:YczE/YyaS/YitT family protein [Brevibacillus sp. H7]|uniref:YczE/YyaS/YitT family protein n=1 Tax=Brevibacillus sp. H7 TaxID=3349138 RepID=UPI003804B595